jgi:lysine-N-methylase
MSTRYQTDAVARFVCLGDKCEDTCCKGWGMQLTQETVDLYKAKAPDLLDAVDSGEAEFIMRRDPNTDYCVKFEDGWCGIHKKHGSDFLGDACHFYPRVTRALGDMTLTTAALSCPETVRLMVMEEGAFPLVPREEARLPFMLKQYLPEGMAPADALELHGLFVAEAGNEAFSAEINLMRLVMVVQALAVQPQAQWLAAAKFYFGIAEGRIPAAELSAHDPFYLAQALYGLIGASKLSHRPRLMQTLSTMMEQLRVAFEGTLLQLEANAAARFIAMKHAWHAHAEEAMQPVLRRYLQSQISVAHFPFAGLGNNLQERMTIIGVRFATTKLALMAETYAAQRVPDDTTIIRVIQSLSRFLDHLADPTFSLQIYQEAGWTKDARLRAVLME